MQFYDSEGLETLKDRFLENLSGDKVREFFDETKTFLWGYQKGDYMEVRTELRYRFFLRNMIVLQAAGVAHATPESFETLLLPVHPVLQIAFLSAAAGDVGELPKRLVSSAHQVSLRETYYWNLSAMHQMLETVEGREDRSYSPRFSVCIREIEEDPLANMHFGVHPVQFSPFDFLVATEASIHFPEWVCQPLSSPASWTPNGRLKDLPDDSPEWGQAEQFIHRVRSAESSDNPFNIEWSDFLPKRPTKKFLKRIIRTRFLQFAMVHDTKKLGWMVV